MENQRDHSTKYSLNDPDLFLNYCIQFEDTEPETQEITGDSSFVLPVLPLNYETVSVGPGHPVHGEQLIGFEETRPRSARDVEYNLSLSVEQPLNYEIVSVGPGHPVHGEQLIGFEETRPRSARDMEYNLSLSVEQPDVVLESPIHGSQLEETAHDTEVTMARIHTFEIEDRVFEEPYTVHVKEDASGWRGWIPDVPEVDCTAHTEKELLEALADKLQEVLEAEEQEWKKLFGEAVKAGKFEPLREEALEDVRAGRFTYL
ncbi:MAG: hypothetical protein OXI43_12570 [Candidatus Poribacteria bacterium]|nr:hypothetical protein [Candidatus Poribacteria bacterium]